MAFVTNSPVFNALKIVAKKLEGKNIDWVVITSCGLALHGLTIVPEDIDILTDLDGLAEIDCALSDYKVVLLEHSPSNKFNSVKSRFLVNGIIVEIMANFKIRSALDGQWQAVDGLIKDHWSIELEQVSIPVLSPEKLLYLYRLMGREEDKPKILALEDYLIKKG